ncbi:N-acetyltransferase [uncultured Shimia sp.]|uniref:GNAT family N-acetyltransferase n=1 Tax=uncultured Shimia sp. TaxID=573152 RepID=UPI0026048819|nr:N-acetyltransferase [uncultured Shimia sp.]
MIIRGYTNSDGRAVRDLLTRAFGQPDEADLVQALRETGDMALELVAESRKKILGHVALSRLQAPKGWLALAPLCADPKQQGKGIGSVLCQMALDYANAPVVVLGDRHYYSRFGFVFEQTGALTSPFPVEHTGLYLPEGTQPPSEQTLNYAEPFMS